MLVSTSVTGSGARPVAPERSSMRTSPATRKTNVVPWEANRFSTVKPSVSAYHSTAASRVSGVTVMPTWSWERVNVMAPTFAGACRGDQ
jgi:hypothetical protein